MFFKHSTEQKTYSNEASRVNESADDIVGCACWGYARVGDWPLLGQAMTPRDRQPHAKLYMRLSLACSTSVQGLEQHPQAGDKHNRFVVDLEQYYIAIAFHYAHIQIMVLQY